MRIGELAELDERIAAMERARREFAELLDDAERRRTEGRYCHLIEHRPRP